MPNVDCGNKNRQLRCGVVVVGWLDSQFLAQKASHEKPSALLRSLRGLQGDADAVGRLTIKKVNRDRCATVEVLTAELSSAGHEELFECLFGVDSPCPTMVLTIAVGTFSHGSIQETVLCGVYQVLLTAGCATLLLVIISHHSILETVAWAQKLPAILR